MTIDLNRTRVWIAELCPEIEAWRVDLIVYHIESQITAEREACAKVCEGVHARHIAEYGDYFGETYAAECFAAIRSRGEEKT